MQEKQFKYQNWIDELAELGCLLPPLYPPGNKQACRFVFSSDEHRNHIPQYISNARRMLQDVAKGRGNTSLIALSCFDTANHAERFYANLQKYIAKDLTLRELVENPNDGFLYSVDIDNDLNYHNVKLVQPSALPEEYLPEDDSYYAFEPIPAMEANEMMTYELTIPYKERSRLEELLLKIGFPVSALKKVVSKAAVF